MLSLIVLISQSTAKLHLSLAVGHHIGTILTVQSFGIAYGTKYIVIDAYIGTATEVVIPDTINVDDEEIPVTTIGSYAFSGCSSLTSIIFGENSQLTSIGERAFYDCSSLTSIVIPNNVTTIGSRAFSGCFNLTIYCEAASKPDGWSSSWNSSCPVVWVSGDIVVDGDYAYVVRTDGEERYVEIVTYLGSGGEVVILHGNETITSVTIGNNVTSIGERAFENCSNLTTVTFGENSQLTSIGDNAFYDCSSLTSIIIPNSVTTIGDNAFYDCSSLTSIIIPDSVTSIGEWAFYGCGLLTSIIIPDSVTTIGDSAFSNCSNLTIYCEAASKPDGWSSSWNSSCPVVWVGGDIVVDGNYAYVVRTSGEERYVEVVRYIGSVEEVIIPDTINVDGEEIKVTTIGERAFYDNDTITSVTIGNNVTSIGERAFYDCSSLTAVTFGENSQLTTISSSAFEGCSSLTSIIIPDSVTSIGYRAFYGCGLLTSIIIPDSVTIIGEYAFRDCHNLTIYCEAASEPSGWELGWDYSCPVVWVSGDIFVDGDYAYVVRTDGEERYVEIVTYLGSGGEVVIHK